MQLRWPQLAEPPVLGAEELHVWAVPVAALVEDFGERIEVLSRSERERVNDFQLDEPRRRFATGRIGLRYLLGHYLQVSPQSVEFSLGKNGKPQLVNSSSASLRFNVAHSGNLALIAVVNGCDVGVDVEHLRKVGDVERLAKRYFHRSEIDEVLTADESGRDAAFLKIWTGKEAVLKAIGTGVAESLSDFRVPMNSQSGTWIELPTNVQAATARCWLKHLEPHEDYVAAVATLDAEHRLRCFTLSILESS